MYKAIMDVAPAIAADAPAPDLCDCAAYGTGSVDREGARKNKLRD
jgi:hypothetical protein